MAATTYDVTMGEAGYLVEESGTKYPGMKITIDDTEYFVGLPETVEGNPSLPETITCGLWEFAETDTFEPLVNTGSPDDDYEDGDFLKFKLPTMYADVVDFPPEFDDCYVGQVHNSKSTYSFVQMYHADGKMGPRIPFFNLAGKVTITKLDYYPLPRRIVDIRLADHEDPDDPTSPIVIEEPGVGADIQVGAGELPEVGVPYVMPSTPDYGLLAALYSDGSFEIMEEGSYTMTPVEGDTVIAESEGYGPFVPGTITYNDFTINTFIGFVETK